MNLKFARSILPFALLAALASGAHAQTEKSGAGVTAEPAAASIAIATSVRADPVDDLKAQVDTITKRVALLEKKLQVAEIAQSSALAADRGQGSRSRIASGSGFRFLEFPGQ